MTKSITTAETLKTKIIAEHIAAQRKAGEAVQHAIRCGEYLIEVKNSLAHGRFLPWIVDNCPFSERAAQRYMKAASNPTRVSHLSSLRAAIEALTVHKIADTEVAEAPVATVHDLHVVDADGDNTAPKVPDVRIRVPRLSEAQRVERARIAAGESVSTVLADAARQQYLGALFDLNEEERIEHLRELVQDVAPELLGNPLDFLASLMGGAR